MAVYLGSEQAARSSRCGDEVKAAIDAGLVILPCVRELTSFMRDTPPGPLQRYNGVEWPDAEAPGTALHFVLETLGLEDKQRMVFLSHRRSDALSLAEQLHDGLIKSRFWPFVDRFDIQPAVNVQQRIYEALEETAFVVLIESPDAESSPWVLEEVHYALRHSLGMLIVSLPDVAPLGGTNDLPRFHVREEMLTSPTVSEADDGGGLPAEQRVLAHDALEALIGEIESIHAQSLVRRKRRLIEHTVVAVERAGLTAREEAGNVLIVNASDLGAGQKSRPPHSIVRFAARPPRPQDLYHADRSRLRLGGDGTGAVLVHAGPDLPQDGAELLLWCRNERDIALLPDHLVGQHWRAA